MGTETSNFSALDRQLSKKFTGDIFAVREKLQSTLRNSLNSSMVCEVFSIDFQEQVSNIPRRQHLYTNVRTIGLEDEESELSVFQYV